ncbi:hypothetical protein JB92DRAFT_3092050 [Gautieria morchelliformis]|nr:hypothetical protein JB92DRAFT_3092050 [Gautieria morchelliformis]
MQAENYRNKESHRPQHASSVPALASHQAAASGCRCKMSRRGKKLPSAPLPKGTGCGGGICRGNTFQTGEATDKTENALGGDVAKKLAGSNNSSRVKGTLPGILTGLLSQPVRVPGQAECGHRDQWAMAMSESFYAGIQRYISLCLQWSSLEAASPPGISIVGTIKMYLSMATSESFYADIQRYIFNCAYNAGSATSSVDHCRHNENVPFYTRLEFPATHGPFIGCIKYGGSRNSGSKQLAPGLFLSLGNLTMASTAMELAREREKDLAHACSVKLNRVTE